MSEETEAERSAPPEVDGAPDGSPPGGPGAAGPVEPPSAQDVYVAVRRAAEPLAILDRAGRLVFVNDAFEDLVEGGRSGLRGERWIELLAPGEAERIERESRPTLRSGEPWRGRVRLRAVRKAGARGTPTGSRVPGVVELSMTPLPDDRVLLGARSTAEREAPPEPEDRPNAVEPKREAAERATVAGSEPAETTGRSPEAPERARPRAAVAGHPPRDPLHDPVTGLASPDLFRELARRTLAAARRDRRSGAVLVVELGLLSGPGAPSDPGEARRLLQVVGRRLQRALDDADAVGLLPDRRFAVAVDDADGEADAVRLGRRLVETLEPEVPARGTRRSPRPAVGIALPSGSDRDPEKLIERASEAATTAGGRKPVAVCVHRPGLGPTVPYRSSLTDELRRALERYALAVHYQPVLQLDAGEPAGAQALVRWPHPRHGLLEASRFVPLAREAGLVRRLDRWVLARAALEGSRSEEGAGRPISVHLGAETWTDPGLPAYVERVLEDRSGRRSPLLLHLGADVARTSLSRLRPVVADLRELDVGLAVEDIRADNASTSYLEGLAPDVVCVERSLTAGAAEDETRLGVLRTLTDVAHTLGARVRAEGVERATELAVVRDAGCDEARGYLIGWPAASRSASGEAFDD